MILGCHCQMLTAVAFQGLKSIAAVGALDTMHEQHHSLKRLSNLKSQLATFQMCPVASSRTYGEHACQQS